MADEETFEFNNEDRVSHKEKGLGTIKSDPADEDLVLSAKEHRKHGPQMVYVVWDDDRFPVGKVSSDELEKLNPATSAVSTGV